MSKKVIMSLILIFIFALSLQITEPVVAKTPKLIDKGSHEVDMSQDGSYKIKTQWKTYQYNKNKILINIVLYEYYQGKYSLRSHHKITIKKIKQKITYIQKNKQSRINLDGFMHYDYEKIVRFEHYTSSVQKYYKKQVRPLFYNNGIGF